MIEILATRLGAAPNAAGRRGAELIPSLTSPISTHGLAIFAGQVIERQGAPRARTPKIGCSADQVYSQGRQCADNWRPSCSCAVKFAGRMASNTATGALSRTRGSPGGAWCSGTCCTSARSTTRRNWRGGGRSRYWRYAPHCRGRRSRNSDSLTRTIEASASSPSQRSSGNSDSVRGCAAPSAQPTVHKFTALSTHLSCPLTSSVCKARVSPGH